jgi:hypothetical protein
MAITAPSAGDSITATWGAAVTNNMNRRAAVAAAVGPVANTETAIVSLTLPANTLVAGDTFRISAFGVANGDGGTPRALTLRVRCGPTTLTGDIATSRAPDINAAASDNGWALTGLFTVRTTGASGTCIGSFMLVGSATQPFAGNAYSTETTATQAIDTTGANILQLTAQTAVAGAHIHVHLASIELVSVP